MATTAVAPADVGVKVGDLFYSSWGYDQTNVDFYKVVALTPKGVKVQKWASRVVGTDRVAPGDGPAQVPVWEKDENGWNGRFAGYQDAPVMTKRLKAGWRGVPGFHLTSYSSASKIEDDEREFYATIHSPGH